MEATGASRPFRIQWQQECAIEPLQIGTNALHALSLGLPIIRQQPAHDRTLAVIGGGASARVALDYIRTLDADKWGINGAAGWLSSQGIPALYFSIDRVPCTDEEVANVPGAIVELSVDRSVFDKLKDKPIRLFKLDDDGMAHGTTTATAAPCISALLGYQRVEFYGCEGCYAPNATHAYKNEDDRADVLVVEAAGMTFLTRPDFLVQSEILAGLINAMPDKFVDCSGGLLRAIRRDPNWSITHCSEKIMASIQANIAKAA